MKEYTKNRQQENKMVYERCHIQNLIGIYWVPKRMLPRLSIILFIVLIAGCKKNTLSEEEIFKYYEINRKNSFSLFSSVMRDSTNNERFKIVHASDSQISKYSSNNHYKKPYNLIEAVTFANEPEFKFNMMVLSGDLIGNTTETSRKEALSYLKVFSNCYFQKNQIPSFVCTGNHDSNMINSDSNQAIRDKDIYAIVTSKIKYPIHTDKQSNYYYADIPNPMSGYIRLIALDVLDQDNLDYDSQHYALTTQKQIDWLCDVALKENMTEKHSVIILLHHSLSSSDIRARTFIRNEFQYGWTFIPEIIEAFRSKTSYTQKYPNRFDVKDSLHIDISFEDTPGEFVCYMGGHLHTYLHYEIDGYKNLNPALAKQIMLVADNLSPSDKNPKSRIERKKEGLRNNTFNIYAIDTRTKTIYITFFGATLFYYPQIITLSYL